MVGIQFIQNIQALKTMMCLKCIGMDKMNEEKTRRMSIGKSKLVIQSINIFLIYPNNLIYHKRMRSPCLVCTKEMFV